MQITILRHGNPDLSEWDKIHSERIPEWIKVYNSAGVKDETKPFCQEILHKLTHNFVICSTRVRSTYSAKIIGYQSPQLIDKVFCEAELPKIQISLIKLTPHIWSMIFRIFWFMGVSHKAESLEAFKLRVSVATERLIEHANNHNSVFLIGHGIINRFLGKELISKGWSGEEAPNGNKYWGYQYWEYATYTKT